MWLLLEKIRLDSVHVNFAKLALVIKKVTIFGDLVLVS